MLKEYVFDVKLFAIVRIKASDKRVAGNTLTRTEKAGLQTTRVSFTVSVPFSYYKKFSDIFRGN